MRKNKCSTIIKPTIHVLVAFFYTLLAAHNLHAQSKAFKKSLYFALENGVSFDNPTPPNGYTKGMDCDKYPIYTRRDGDTIFLYSWSGSIAEDLTAFKESLKDSNFNITKYPSMVQDNGTIIMVMMNLNKFIWRHDTLYLYDNYNSVKLDSLGKILLEQINAKTNPKALAATISSIDTLDFGFVPGYRIIYFKGMFDTVKDYTLPDSGRNKKERITLHQSWMVKGKRMFEIVVSETSNSGEFKFSEDLKVIETTNCYEINEE